MSKELPLAETIQLSAMLEVCDLVETILIKECREGVTSGRLSEEARVALAEGVVMVDRETDKMERYPDHINKASVLLGEIKYNSRYKSDVDQEAMNVMCTELEELVGAENYTTLIDAIKDKPQGEEK